MNNIVVSIHRDTWSRPKLTITVEARLGTQATAQEFITRKVMEAYDARTGKRFKYIKVKDYRVVDEVGLRRLQAAAKASATIRRKRAAKKAAATRARNKVTGFKPVRTMPYNPYY